MKEIVEVSSNNNKKRDISGCLVFDGNACIQILEGDRTVVSELFLKVARDERHDRIAIMEADDAHARIFANWSMNYISFSQKYKDIYAKYSPTEILEPQHMTAQGVIEFFKEISLANQSKPA